MDEDSNPYTSLRDWENVDIEDYSKQDILKMWQSSECGLQMKVQRQDQEIGRLQRELEAQNQRNAVPVATFRRGAPTDL